MKHIRLYATASLLFLFALSLSAADSGGLEEQLRQVVEANLAAYNSEDAARTLASVHTKSPAYAAMREALPKQFGALDASTVLERFSYIGHDDEFAVARIQYRTVGGAAKPFMNNILDTITVFHEENGTWKYWDHHILGVRPVK